MSADSVNDDRMADYLDDLDAAAELPTLQRRATMPVAAVIRPRRLDMTADDIWKAAWKRGLVGDVEMTWHVQACRMHPASWLGWLHQYL